MSIGGMYKIIDDRIYLYEYTGKILFETIGCKVDIKGNELYISNTVV